jgi:hypothetical protein
MYKGKFAGKQETAITCMRKFKLAHIDIFIDRAKGISHGAGATNWYKRKKGRGEGKKVMPK